MEVILVDDGSDKPEAITCLDQLEADFNSRGWRIIRQQNSYLGAARNRAAQEAKGKYLLFMDDDNVATSGEISTFVQVAERTGIEILTCVIYLFEEPSAPTDVYDVWVPYGDAPGLSVLMNSFGDANALINRETFEAVGGFTEEYGVGHEDWEFFAKATLKGHSLEVIPEPLYYYRKTQDGMLNATNREQNLARSISPYLRAYPDFAPLFLFSQGLYEKQQESVTRTVQRYANEIETLQAKLGQLQSDLNDCRDELVESEKHYNQVTHSTIWRSTQIIRTVGGTLRRYWKN